jgi:hypothetical protein
VINIVYENDYVRCGNFVLQKVETAYWKVGEKMFETGLSTGTKWEV